jgi:hypothetical protein
VLTITGHFPGLAAQIIVGNMSELVYLNGELIQAEFDMVLQHILWLLILIFVAKGL